MSLFEIYSFLPFHFDTGLFCLFQMSISGLSPSVSVGVVAKVVKAKRSCSSLSVIREDAGDIPAMLETTAAVHPGASGGLVVNFDGCMIGLITRYSNKEIMII